MTQETTDAPEAMRPLLNKLGAAKLALDAWTLRNGENVLSMTKPQVERYSELLKATASAKATVRAAWNDLNHRTNVPLPPQYQ